MVVKLEPAMMDGELSSWSIAEAVCKSLVPRSGCYQQFGVAASIGMQVWWDGSHRLRVAGQPLA